jgi:LysR family carnitine catabolism transcriptional activator
MRHTFSLRQIEGFLLASETHSFSRAAESMRISQSAFSQLIRELETSLGVRLFDRTTRRVTMTEAGEAMYRKMSGAIDAIDEACDEAQAISRIERGHLTLGTLSSLAAGLVTRTLGRLRRDYPGITVSLQEAGNGEIVSRVAKGELDLAVCAQTDNAPGLTFKPFFDDELVIAAPNDHRLAAAGSIKWSDLDGESVVMAQQPSATYDHVAARIAENNIALTTEYDTATLFTGLSMARSGFGLTFVSRVVTLDVNMDGLSTVRIENPPTRRIGIYRKIDRSASPTAVRFEEFLRGEVNDSLRRLQMFTDAAA